MTAPNPISPDDTAALAAMLMRVVRCGGTGDGWNFAEAARTVAQALIPPGFVVVRTDDLREVLDASRSYILPLEVAQRLRALLGDDDE